TDGRGAAVERVFGDRRGVRVEPGRGSEPVDGDGGDEGEPGRVGAGRRAAVGRLSGWGNPAPGAGSGCGKPAPGTGGGRAGGHFFLPFFGRAGGGGSSLPTPSRSLSRVTP